MNVAVILPVKDELASLPRLPGDFSGLRPHTDPLLPPTTVVRWPSSR